MPTCCISYLFLGALFFHVWKWFKEKKSHVVTTVSASVTKLPWRGIQYRLQVLHFRQQRETILGDYKHPVVLVFHGLASPFLAFVFVCFSKYYTNTP